jgi:hypothetical protein
LYDAYRTAGIHVTGVWDWYLLQIDVYGLPVVLVWQAGGLIALWCGIGGICHLADRLRDRRTQRRDRAAAWRQLCFDPPQRETAPGSHINDLITCMNILDATEQTRKEKPQP